MGSATTVATAARKFCYVPEISSYAASAVIEFCIRSVRNKSYNLKQDDRGLKFLSWFVRSAQACEHLARGSCESGEGADDITFVMTKSPDFAAFLQGMSFRSSSPVHLRIPHQKANFRSSNFPSFVFPFVCAAKTLKVERHSLRGCEREKHCFLMIAPWALHVCRTRKRWIGSDILDYCCCFCCSMADTVTMDTKVFGINPVVAVQASVN